MRFTLTLAAVALVAALGVPAAAHPGRPSEGTTPRVGVLVADHGEPPEYNADTYYSFREFFAHLIEMGFIPRWVTLLDAGTVLHDRLCPACDAPRADPELIDAWLRPHQRPAMFVPSSDRLPAHYVTATGPGLGEPDIYEHVGLMARLEWEQMGGRSPNYDQKLPKKAAVIRRLRDAYGQDLSVRVGYGIDPRLGGGHQGLPQAVAALVNRDRVDTIVVAYHGVGFSDIMQTHMIRARVEDLVAALDPSVKLVFADPVGVSPAYVDGVVAHVQREVAKLPEHAAVAVHLSEHGLSTTTCGEYDCGADAYHAFAAELFARTRTAILAAVNRPGRLDVFQVYGDGGEGDADPDDEVDSPMEALTQRKSEGFRRVIDVPYAFDSDSRDTLIVLRRGYRRPIPDWDVNYESSFRHKGLKVRITNTQFGAPQKITAFTDVIAAGLDAALRGAGERPGGGARH